MEGEGGGPFVVNSGWEGVGGPAGVGGGARACGVDGMGGREMGGEVRGVG